MNNNRIDDREYWERYYSERREPFEPSRFSQYVAEKYIKAGDSVVELGCGNGRDAVSFAMREGVTVVAVDQCEKEIAYLTRSHGNEHLSFRSGDFTNLPLGEKFTHVYSRFTIHSISVEGQAAVLDWAHSSLQEHGFFLLEFRGKKNDLFGLGDPVNEDPNAFVYEDHYRRFLDLEETCRQLETIGFKIVESVEKKGFSPFNGTDETFARIIAQKVS